MIDPLVLDTNKDGFISTVALADSNVYFNMVGDAQKERIGWVKPEDALLVYDENQNGQIDGFEEVFGNMKIVNNISYKKIVLEKQVRRRS